MADSRPEVDTTERLQKVLARAGVGSRRHCEEMIGAGRVSVDGVVVDRQGVKVDPSVARILVDGVRIAVPNDLTYLMLNKPAGVVTTMHDEQGRPSIADYVAPKGLFHVGRLDAATEGLLVLTSDGELAHRLMHPSYAVRKTYLAVVEGTVGPAQRRQLLAGVSLEDGPARADRVRVTAQAGGRAAVELEVHEGRNRLVRRMLAAIDRPVLELVRVAYGPLVLGDLRRGRVRPLTSREVGALQQSVKS